MKYIFIILIVFSTSAMSKTCVNLTKEGSTRIKSIETAMRIFKKRGLKLEVNPYLDTKALPELVATLKACFRKAEESHGRSYTFTTVTLDNTRGSRVFTKDKEFSSGPTTIEDCYVELITEGLK